MVKNLWIAVASLAFMCCSPQSQLIVVNESNVELRDVVATGSGFSQRLGTIAPHTQRRVAIHSQGKSALEVRFKAGERVVSSGPDEYFEGSGGYRITATIWQDLHASVKSELSSY
jgi:hypothetical protein